MKDSISKWFGGLASLLSSVAAIVCPLCIPALGAFIASAGLGFALSTEFMRDLLVILLAVSLGSLAWSSKLHGQWWILAVASLGAVIVYSGRHVWFNPPLMWTGAAILIGASLVNFRVERGCSRCAVTESQSRKEGVQP